MKNSCYRRIFVYRLTDKKKKKKLKKGSLIKQSAIYLTIGLCPIKRLEWKKFLYIHWRRNSTQITHIPRSWIKTFQKKKTFEGNALIEKKNRKKDTRCKHYWNRNEHIKIPQKSSERARKCFFYGNKAYGRSPLLVIQSTDEHMWCIFEFKDVENVSCTVGTNFINGIGL